MLDTDTKCTLCQNSVSLGNHVFEEEDAIFCCKGCQVVYQILKAQESLDNFHNHPVYKQAVHSGLISNPYFQITKLEEEKISEDDFQKMHITIQNMWCPSCAQVIHLIMLKEKGIRKCVVDYATDLAIIEYTPRLISKEKIFYLIRQMGYSPQYLEDPRKPAISRSLMLRFIIAAFFSLNVMMFAYPIYASYFDAAEQREFVTLFAWLSFGGSLPVIFYSAWPIWRRCLLGFKVGIWGMEALVSMGVIAATVLSIYELSRDHPDVYFDSITVIIMFVLLGKMIESKAKFSAKDALFKLSLGLPRRGRKLLDTGEEQFVSIKEIKPGDFFVVRMGEKIVLDGIVERGVGTCDESFMTGESQPIPKNQGSTVLAGTILIQGNLIIKVTAVLEETSLYRIVDCVSEEIEHKSKYIRSADQIVKWFVPFVVCLAVGTAVFCFVWGVTDGEQTAGQTAMIRAISVLLISCPCAIGIAAPLAESCVLNVLAKNGIIVRNRGCLTYLGQETVFIFDKTGTVTEGNFTVLGGLEQLSYEDQKTLKGLVVHSIHPLSVALCGALFCPISSFENVEEIVGKGLKGKLQGQMYYLGSASFMIQQEIALPEFKDLSNASLLTPVYFAKGKHCLTILWLGDRIREGAREFIQFLSPFKTILISGDASSVVEKVAKECHFKEWHAGCLPFQKKEFIDNLKKENEVVAMLGDGINDAPALTAAHIGIAVLSASDMSVQVSDLLLTTHNFQSLCQLRYLALKGKKIVKQNLFWAFFYNLIGLGLAVAGMLTPLFSACAMVISSIIVLMNSRRINTKTSEK